MRLQRTRMTLKNKRKQGQRIRPGRKRKKSKLSINCSTVYCIHRNEKKPQHIAAENFQWNILRLSRLSCSFLLYADMLLQVIDFLQCYALIGAAGDVGGVGDDDHTLSRADLPTMAYIFPRWNV